MLNYTNPRFAWFPFTRESQEQNHHLGDELVLGDPSDAWFEPLLAHFEQLRLMYESSEEDVND